jgi:RING-type zinc-finger
MVASITNNLSAEHIKELITCPICLDIFDDPRLLPCSHTICYKCIQEMVRVNGKFTCPFRDGTEVSQDAIAGLPLNRIVKNIVDSLKSNPAPVPQPVPRPVPNPEPRANNVENKEILDLSVHSSLARGGERYRDFHSTAYGYQFNLSEPIRLSSVEVKLDVDGPVTVAITNAATT